MANAARELVATFYFGMDFKELENGVHRAEHTLHKLKAALAVAVEAFAVEKVYEWAEANVKAMSEIEQAAVRLGIGTEKVQLFQYAAKSMGLEAEAVTQMLGKMQVQQQAAIDGSGKAAKAFSDMGVGLKDANGHAKSADELFGDVAEAISKQKDASKQAALATTVFGKSGRQLLPLLKEGREGVQGLTQEFKELGGGFDEEAIKGAKAFEKQSAKLTLALTGVKNVIMKALMPVITAFHRGVTFILNTFRKLSEHSNIVQATLLVLGSVFAYVAGTIVVAMLPVIAPFLLIGLAILGLIFIVDELITTFQGGDSLIRRFIDKAFGVGSTTELVDTLKGAWEAVIETIKIAYNWVVQHAEMIKEVAGAMAKVAGIIWKVGTAPVAAARYVAEQGADLVGRGRNALLESGIEGSAAIGARGGYNSSGEFVPFPAQGGGGATNVEVTVNPSPGMDEKALGEHTAKVVGEVIKKRNRQAANTYQRGTAQE